MAQCVLQWPQLLVVMQVFQRQMSKEGLQAVVNGNDAAGGGWSSEMLRDLFTLREDIASDTYDSRCRCTEESTVDDDDEAGPLPPPEYKQQVLWHHPIVLHGTLRSYSSCFRDVGRVRQLPILQLLVCSSSSPYFSRPSGAALKTLLISSSLTAVLLDSAGLHVACRIAG